MAATYKRLPALPSLSPWRLVSRGNSKWRSHYPFSSPDSQITLLARVALYHGLRAMDLPDKPVVLVPNYHEGVEIDTLLAFGARLIYYRVNHDLDIDLEDVKSRLTDDASILYVIHYFGRPQPMKDISAFCREQNLRLVEDCALSLFSRTESDWLGSFGDLAIFSVHKTCPAPGLGLLRASYTVQLPEMEPVPSRTTVVHTADLFRRHVRGGPFAFIEAWLTALRRLVTRTTTLDIQEDINPEEGQWDDRLIRLAPSTFSFRLMNYVDPERIIAARRRNYEILADRLSGRPEVPLPDLTEGQCPLFFPILVDQREKMQKRLHHYGVESIKFWSTIHPTCPDDFGRDVAAWRDGCLVLGVHQGLSKNQMHAMAGIVERVLSEFDQSGQRSA